MLKLQLDRGTDQVDLERMISDAHLLQKELRYMCRSCFYAYNKVVKAQEFSYILCNCVVYMYRVRKSKLIGTHCDILRTLKHWQFFYASGVWLYTSKILPHYHTWQFKKNAIGVLFD